VPVHNAPADALARAKSLVSGGRRVFAGKLFGSSLTLAQARSATADFQLMVGAEDQRIRLMYSRLPGDRWEVKGRAPGADWAIRTVDSTIPCDAEGGFSLEAESLQNTGFSLIQSDAEILIPSAQELLDGDSS
ncbi:MAG: hypothetical protein QOJ65_551, partial [Fimbriimonadaceae bacterium]|nr:hypothetical protein [Fimbriimonadaceae bacterium]